MINTERRLKMDSIEPLYLAPKNNRVNAMGLKCPEPLMLLKVKLDEVNQFDRVDMATDDANAVKSVEEFCHKRGYESTLGRAGGTIVFRVRKT